jgi:hypothetical protein
MEYRYRLMNTDGVLHIMTDAPIDELKLIRKLLFITTTGQGLLTIEDIDAADKLGENLTAIIKRAESGAH